jgi:hypothetical protein
VLSPDAIRAAARRLDLPLSQALHHDLERRGAIAGWSALEAWLREIQASGLFDAAALMTPMDPSPVFTARLRSVLARVAFDRAPGEQHAEPDAPHCAVQ